LQLLKHFLSQMKQRKAAKTRIGLINVAGVVGLNDHYCTRMVAYNGVK